MQQRCEIFSNVWHNDFFDGLSDKEKGSYILANGLQAVRWYGNNPFCNIFSYSLTRTVKNICFPFDALGYKSEQLYIINSLAVERLFRQSE